VPIQNINKSTSKHQGSKPPKVYKLNSTCYLLVTCRCRAWEAGCFKCPTLHIGRVDSWTRWQTPPWPLIPVITYSNVTPHVDWRNFFSIQICFFWYRVSTHVLLCHIDSYHVWRNSVGQHLLCLSRFCTSRWDHLVVFFSPVKSASVSYIYISLSSYGNLQKNLW